VKRALVTGCAGFIGSHLCRALLADGWEVRGIDDFSVGVAGRVSSDVEMVIGDVCDAPLMRSLAAGCDVVYHLAVRNIMISADDVEDSWRVNTLGPGSVYHAALAQAHPPLVVFTSSVSVYGQADVIPTPESAPYKAGNPYTAAKIAAELYGLSLLRLRDLPLVIVRPSNVYGPGHREGPVNRFLARYAAGQPAIIEGNGQATRDYTYVADVVRGIRSTASREYVGQIFNLGTGKEVSLLSLAGLCADAVGCTAAVTFVPQRAYETVARRAMDATRARIALGWKPLVSLEDSLRQSTCISAADVL